MSPTSVLITNGNAMTMLALGEWLNRHGSGLRKVFVTYKLPSSRGNVRGVFKLLMGSGLSYTYLKVWVNRIFPRSLRNRGLPCGVADWLALLGLDIPVELVESVNTPTVVQEIRAIEPDYLVSFSATQRFKDPLIGTPRTAAVNMHYGALPAYAGLDPYFWHLYNQEPDFGVTLHRIVTKLDAGPIVEQVFDTTSGVHTCLALMLRMANLASPLLCRLFDGETSIENATSQPTTGRSYFRHPSRKQVGEFQKNGYAMLDAESKRKAIQAIEELTRRVHK